MGVKEFKKKDQKDYMKSEYAKMWTQMRNKEYQYGYYDKFLLNLIRKSLKKSKKKKILDVCCGDGNPFARKLIPQYDYFGIDISNHLIKIAKKNYGKDKFKLADVEKLNIRAKFDLIICFHSLWYLPNYLNIIRNLSKLLKPNGYLIFDSLNKNNSTNMKDFEKIVYETRGFGKLMRFLKNIIKIFLKPGYTKWSNVIHHRLNDIQKINKIISNKKIFSEIVFFGLIENRKKFFKIRYQKNKRIGDFTKIIFKCKKL